MIRIKEFTVRNIVLLALILGSGPVVLSDNAAAQIEPYTDNPWYWQYQGNPIMLYGGSNRDNLFQWTSSWAQSLTGTATTLAEHLDLLQSLGGNYLRNTMSSREYLPGGVFVWDTLPQPFAKVGGQFDLNQWDPTYWNNLDTMLSEAQSRGMIVQIELWDRDNERGDSNASGDDPWKDSAWNPDNNSTYSWSDSPLLTAGSTGALNAFHLAANTGDPVLLPLQERFVEKIIDTVIDGGYDNVIYQVANESGAPRDNFSNTQDPGSTLQPDPFWAQKVLDYAASKGETAYVATSRRFRKPNPYPTTNFQDPNNPEIRVPIENNSFNFTDISQNNGESGQLQYDNFIWYRNQVEQDVRGARPINNTKSYYFNWPTGTKFSDRTAGTDEEAGARMWRAVFAGAASFRFHRDTPTSIGIRNGLGLTTESAELILGMTMLLDEINIFTMEPNNDLLSLRTDDEAYSLAELGEQFAVFFTGSGNQSIQLDVSSLSGDRQLRWLDVANSLWIDVVAPTDPLVTLSAPSTGQWVAVLSSLTLPGDFDSDGDVDGTDFLVWQRGFGAEFGATDLSDWESNYGTVGGGAAVGVPEPSAVALLVIGLTNVSVLITRRRRSRSYIEFQINVRSSL